MKWANRMKMQWYHYDFPLFATKPQGTLWGMDQKNSGTIKATSELWAYGKHCSHVLSYFFSCFLQNTVSLINYQYRNGISTIKTLYGSSLVVWWFHQRITWYFGLLKFTKCRWTVHMSHDIFISYFVNYLLVPLDMNQVNIFVHIWLLRFRQVLAILNKIYFWKNKVASYRICGLRCNPHVLHT